MKIRLKVHVTVNDLHGLVVEPVETSITDNLIIVL
jgi:hypothetical protein